MTHPHESNAIARLATGVVSLLGGKMLASFDDRGERRTAIAFAYVPGHEPCQDNSLVIGFRRLGAISARLHAHAREWARPPSFARKVWNVETILCEHPHWGSWREATGLGATGPATVARAEAVLRRRLRDYGDLPARFGLIHADLRPANLLVHRDTLTVIDFDDCGFGWHGFDLAAALSFIEETPAVPVLIAAWLTGYRSVAAWSTEDEAMLPSLIMLRRIQLTAWLASHADSDTARQLGEGHAAGTVRPERRYNGNLAT